MLQRTCPLVKFMSWSSQTSYSCAETLPSVLYLVLIIVLHNASQPKWFSTSVQVFNKEWGSTCQHFSLCTSCQPSCRELSNIPITWNQHLIFCSTLNNFSVIWMSGWDYSYNASCSVYEIPGESDCVPWWMFYLIWNGHWFLVAAAE